MKAKNKIEKEQDNCQEEEIEYDAEEKHEKEGKKEKKGKKKERNE